MPTHGRGGALAYFDKLDENILQYTGRRLRTGERRVAGECAIALSLTFKAVDLINEGADLDILFSKRVRPIPLPDCPSSPVTRPGSPVIDVVTYFYSDVIDDYLSTYLPEKVKVDQVNSVENYPTDIPYADMSNNTPDVKEALLAKWEH